VTIISVSKLRQNLQSYLALVAGGERIRVTSHGRTVAEIAQPAVEADAAAAARQRLRGSVLNFDRPTEPAWSADEWPMHQPVSRPGSR
jgi:antitoxin (DNA-binding transcriptional repressor) of toxin-antitoxin stability system